MKTIAKIIRELEKVNTPEEWNDVYRAVNIVHGNFTQQQKIMQRNIKKAEERQKNEILKGKWKVGDRVSFDSVRDKEKCLGVIIKRNPKRARIQVYVGTCKGEWAVPYHHLSKITDKQEITELTVGKMSET